MANFDRQELEHLQKLCRIDCSEEEKQDILKSLQRILEYVDQLDQVQTGEAKVCNHVMAKMASNRWREDIPHDLMSREQFLANAPDQIAGMIRVPPVLKQP
ncbi:MAG TPA: Asp-tRNA(Asn)/Glu-tRNA(Gln) amidotransferase subunit GatC [Chlamydiales bacterium]|nr:Asp-tRNA(Asn)/Glu-tRNA(Gln) amidotransferase subunit GatC [Chlamydiales bacterium]